MNQKPESLIGYACIYISITVALSINGGRPKRPAVTGHVRTTWTSVVRVLQFAVSALYLCPCSIPHLRGTYNHNMSTQMAVDIPKLDVDEYLTSALSATPAEIHPYFIAFKDLYSRK